MGFANRNRMGDDHDTLVRAGLLVVASTLLLTAVFVGILALVSGNAVDVESRLPAYVLVLAVTFVGGLLVVEQRGPRTARDVMRVAGGAAVGVFVAVALACEGALYAYSAPDLVFSSRTFLYFLAAAFIGTGLGYWGITHRRELTRPTGDRL